MHTKLIICHTRWHTNDLQGYLKEHNPSEYEFLEFPAIKPDGTPLWKERFNIEFLNNQLEEMGERLFSSIYQQQPLDSSGSFFNLDNLRFNEEINSGVISKVRSWDIAYSNEEKGDINDYTAGIYMQKTIDGFYIISQLTYGQFGNDLKNKIKSTARLDTPNTQILIETGTVGGASRFYFNELKKSLQGYRVKQSEPIGAKVDRASPFRDAVYDGRIIINLPDHQREQLIRQLQEFPLGRHDDIIDACSYAYNYLSSHDNREIRGSKTHRKRIKLNGFNR